MFEAFFIKIIGFEFAEKFGDVTGFTVMGGPAKLQLLIYGYTKKKS